MARRATIGVNRRSGSVKERKKKKKITRKNRKPVTKRSVSRYESPSLTIPVSPEKDHIQGPSDAPLTLVEYGDYQCPYCGAAYSEVKKVQRNLGSKLKFVFRNFPMTTLHEFALISAESAEAADAQGRFWEMHDFLYEHQATLGNRDTTLNFARELGLDTQRFEGEISQHIYLDKIRKDFNGGVRSGVNGTPTFYVNGRRYDGPAMEQDILLALNEGKITGLHRPARSEGIPESPLEI